MRRLKKITSLLDSAMAVMVFISFGLLMCAVLIVCAEVVLRYIMNRPLTWVEQVSGYILVYIVFLNAAWVLKKERHVRLDILHERLSPKSQNWLLVVTSFLGAIICLIVTWFGAVVTWDYFQTGTPSVEILPIPLFFIWWVIPVGGFLLFIQFLRRAFGFLATMRTTTDERQSSKNEP
jgi:C4-dicarboxylate transporter DctQ subunit